MPFQHRPVARVTRHRVVLVTHRPAAPVIHHLVAPVTHRLAALVHHHRVVLVHRRPVARVVPARLRAVATVHHRWPAATELRRKTAFPAQGLSKLRATNPSPARSWMVPPPRAGWP